MLMEFARVDERLTNDIALSQRISRDILYVQFYLLIFGSVVDFIESTLQMFNRFARCVYSPVKMLAVKSDTE